MVNRISLNTCSERAGRKDGEGLFTRVCSDRTRGTAVN